MESKIEIPLSKLKIGLHFMGAVTFVILGIQFAINPEGWLSSRSNSPEFVRIMGLMSIVFFGTCGVFIGRKIFDEKIGLIIDENGITDNTNATSIGLIEWCDITGIDRVEIASSKILIIRIDKPNKYIERAKNGIAKRAMKANNKMYGSPISIISSSLRIKFNELENLVESELKRRKK
ncbi:MAG: STM3941 family protein [Saprospiraceae bacterium]